MNWSQAEQLKVIVWHMNHLPRDATFLIESELDREALEASAGLDGSKSWFLHLPPVVSKWQQTILHGRLADRQPLTVGLS
jgi:hypothetical protein